MATNANSAPIGACKPDTPAIAGIDSNQDTGPDASIPAHFSAPLPYIDPPDMPDLYAITGVGRCMQPLHPDGTLLVGDKRQEPEPGDIVVVHFRRDAAPRYGAPGWVKRLVHLWPIEGEETLITLEQLNPPRRYVVPMDHVAAMHKCIGTAISQGNGYAILGKRTEG